MAIDPRILLAGQTPDALASIVGGYNAGNAIRQRPMQDKLNQQKLAAGQLELDAAKQKGMSDRELARIKSVYTGALQIQPYMAANDAQGTLQALQRRKAMLKEVGYDDTTETDAAIETLSKGGIAALKPDVDNMITVGDKLFGKAQTNRSFALPPGAQLRDSQGNLLAENTNVKAGMSHPADPFFTQMDTTQGKYILDARTGKYAKAVGDDGKPLLSGAVDPANKEAVSTADARGKVIGEYQGETTTGAGQALQKLKAVTAQIDNVTGQIDDAISNADWTTAGPGGLLASKISSMPAYNQKELIKTIQSNIGFDKLQQMRDMSPTGGALGQVAVQELESLQKSIASLDQGQDPQVLKNNLRRVRQHYDNWKDAVVDAYQQRYQKPNGPTPPPPGGSKNDMDQFWE